MRIRSIVICGLAVSVFPIAFGETRRSSTSTDVEAPVQVASMAGPAAFELSWYTIDGGGVMHSPGGAFELSGTVGQPDAGRMSGAGGIELTGGFWFEVLLSDCNEDGVVNLSDYVTFEGCLSGPAGGPVPVGCDCYDFNGDGVVTLLDFAAMQVMFNGY